MNFPDDDMPATHHYGCVLPDVPQKKMVPQGILHLNGERENYDGNFPVLHSSFPQKISLNPKITTTFACTKSNML